MFCYASSVPRLRPQRHLGSPDQWIPVRAVRLSTQLPVLFVVSDSEGEFFIFILSAMPPVAPCRLRTVIVIRNEWEAEFFAEEGYLPPLLDDRPTAAASQPSTVLVNNLIAQKQIGQNVSGLERFFAASRSLSKALRVPQR